MTVERWTDGMLDGLALSVSELRNSVSELGEKVDTLRDSVDGLRVTAQALLQVAAQSQRDMELMKQRQAESDARFNVLLEEVRYLSRRNNQDENV